MPRLSDSNYLAFPFRINGSSGPVTATREAHVRGQIEQTLFTAPGERIFRPEFGAGARRLVFEPYTAALAQITSKRLSATLADVLRGEVDPRTLEIEVIPGDGMSSAEGRLELSVTYRLATINRDERHVFSRGDHG
jgi:uncharacterized protein